MAPCPRTWLPSSAIDTDRTGTSTSGTSSQLQAPAVTSHTRMLPSWSPEMSSFWPAFSATVLTGPRDSNSRWQRRARMSQILTDLSSEPAAASTFRCRHYVQCLHRPLLRKASKPGLWAVPAWPDICRRASLPRLHWHTQVMSYRYVAACNAHDHGPGCMRCDPPENSQRLSR